MPSFLVTAPNLNTDSNEKKLLDQVHVVQFNWYKKTIDRKSLVLVCVFLIVLSLEMADDRSTSQK